MQPNLRTTMFKGRYELNSEELEDNITHISMIITIKILRNHKVYKRNNSY